MPQNKPKRALKLLVKAIEQGTLVMPPPVLMELLSFPALSDADRDLLRYLPRIELGEELWERAAETRRALLAKKLKARAIDCLIAQCCIDGRVPLVTNDQDSRYFSMLGLELL